MIKINSIYKKIESDATTRLRFSLGCFRIHGCPVLGMHVVRHSRRRDPMCVNSATGSKG
jgi:hypothetical protein